MILLGLCKECSAYGSFNASSPTLKVCMLLILAI